jgi:hypothetical protein
VLDFLGTWVAGGLGLGGLGLRVGPRGLGLHLFAALVDADCKYSPSLVLFARFFSSSGQSTSFVSNKWVVCWMRSRWSRPCGLGLGGLDLAASSLVVSTCAVSASAVVSACGVSAPVASTLRSRLRWSRPVRSRPPRLRLGLCSLDLSVGVI